MKALLRLVFLFLAVVFSAQNPADSLTTPSSNLNSERILSFESDIRVGTDRTAHVKERITVNALGIEIKRGIFRTLPLNRNLNNKTEKVNYKIISVKRNGAEEKYHTEKSNGFMYVYIGDEDVVLPSGVYTYEITYDAGNQIGFFKDYDEFYWNVNGNFWSFPVDEVQATVHLPENAKILQSSCYTGSYGSKNQNCSSTSSGPNVMTWKASNLREREGLTIAAGFQKNIIQAPAPPGFIEKNGALALCGLALAFLMSYFYRSWDKFGRDPEKPVVYPQFNAPKNMSPASIGYFNKEYFDNNLITASLVNLAVKGFISIEESKPEDDLTRFFGKKKFILKKLREGKESLAKEEKLLMNSLFRNKEIVVLDGEYDEKIEKVVKQFQSNLEVQHDTTLNEGNNWSKLLVPGLVITAVFAVAVLLQNHFYGNDDSLVLAGFFFLIVSVIAAVTMFFSKKIKLSWKWIGLFLIIGINAVSGIIGMVSAISNFESASFYLLIPFLFLVISIIALMVFKYFIRKPSPEYQENKSLIDGFKMYMGAAENEQLKFHNPPEMTPKVFETMLPYAIVLGVDKIWGEKFANILRNSSMSYENNWYVGQGFSPSSFGSTLSSNLSSSVASASTAPSSSSSGSGGGGSSGGGGGGGGGGGW